MACHALRVNSSDRRIALRGTHNFRDLGGYVTADGRRVRMGRVFRSDNLGRLAPSAFEAFLRLNVRTIIDFRTDPERQRRPNRLPPGHDITTHNQPVSLMPAFERSANTPGLAWTVLTTSARHFPHDLIMQIYASLHERAAEAVSRMFELLRNDANHPALIMCAGGKDRTGFGSAMLLLTLGVPVSTVVEDYLLTAVYTEPVVDRLVRRLRWLSLYRLRPENIRPLLLAREEYLLTALRQLEATHGSVDEYAHTRLGLSPQARSHLQELLLEPPPGSPADKEEP